MISGRNRGCLYSLENSGKVKFLGKYFVFLNSNCNCVYMSIKFMDKISILQQFIFSYLILSICARQQLEAMLNELKELPARLRMYDSYEFVRKLLQSYTKVNMHNLSYC